MTFRQPSCLDCPESASAVPLNRGTLLAHSKRYRDELHREWIATPQVG